MVDRGVVGGKKQIKWVNSKGRESQSRSLTGLPARPYVCPCVKLHTWQGVVYVDVMCGLLCVDWIVSHTSTHTYYTGARVCTQTQVPHITSHKSLQILLKPDKLFLTSSAAKPSCPLLQDNITYTSSWKKETSTDQQTKWQLDRKMNPKNRKAEHRQIGEYRARGRK